MNDWTIRRRIIFSFSIVLSLMLLMGLVTLAYLSHIDDARVSLENDSLPGLYLGDQLMIAALHSHALTLAHALATDPATMSDLREARAAALERLDTLAHDYLATILRPADRANFEQARRALAQYVHAQDELLARTGAQRDELARASADLHARFEQTHKALRGLVNDNKRQADQSSAQIGAAVRAAQQGVVAGKTAALVISLLCAFALLRAVTEPLARLVKAVDVVRTGNFAQRLTLARRDEFATLADGFNRMSEELAVLVEQVQKAGVQVDGSVSEIAASSRQQQATASEIAATTAEIGATSREISATSKELVKTMNDVAQVAEHSATLAGRGQTGLSQMETTMRRVAEATGAINGKLAILNEKAGNISQVVTTITKVADQTNLLSLNAAIEAEKAGEYGRGFAVVATEIRRLADQTAVATYDIEQMVKEIQSAVSAGVMGMDRFAEEVRRGMQETQQVGAELSEIIQRVQAMAPRCEAVSEGMQAQATGAEQITDALAQLSEAAQQTVETLRQSNLAIGELNQVAGSLRTGIARFTLDA